MATKDDPTIKALYGIAQRVFEDEAAKEDARQDAISTICNQAMLQFDRAIALLEEDVPDSGTRKRTRDCLADGLELMQTLRTKHTTSPASTSTTEEQLVEPSPAANRDDWKFVDDYRNQHGTKMKWSECYKAGKDAGLFSKYKSIKSACGERVFRLQEITNIEFVENLDCPLLIELSSNYIRIFLLIEMEMCISVPGY